MREIISAFSSPTHNITKWLVKEFQSMSKKFDSHCEKNNAEFLDAIQSVETIADIVRRKIPFPKLPSKASFVYVRGLAPSTGQHLRKEG